ncbi:MAG: bifunctional phosphoribosylaminoimidazolecarboxamide formyltransferase/IMP cyclohydrolase [Lysobacterales bacterium]
MTDATQTIPRRALLSVSDKTGIIDLARGLDVLGISVLSTGGTAREIRDAGVVVTDVSDITGFPEIMGGRVKTLHPAVHGGLLGRPGVDDEVMREHGIEPIGILVVNLYPFVRVAADSTSTPANVIENIDIGGPAMLRAAAKNHEHVAVVVDPADYAELLAALRHGGTTPEFRRCLAAKAFAHTAAYDAAIAHWFGARRAGNQAETGLPPTLDLAWRRERALRYGENPHQQAALYLEPGDHPGTVAHARQLAGKALSSNNLADADTAIECVKAMGEAPACVIVKHANPCGVALGSDLADAYGRAYACDPVSAFGGIIAFNRTFDAAAAQAILARQFVEVIVAPHVDSVALEVVAAKPNIRVLATGVWPCTPTPALDFKRIAGGLLVQTADHDALRASDLRIVTRRAPTGGELDDLLFAWRVAMFVKSNAIVYARDLRTIGIGAGQMSRIDSARLAAQKAAAAGLELTGCAMASDAFFPFRDSIDTAAAAGICSVIQPGGSIRDDEVIAAADAHGIAMAFTGTRHFRH